MIQGILLILFTDGNPITNTLIYLGAAINVMAKETFITLGLYRLRHTLTVLELADRSFVKPKGMLEDILITVDSWWPIHHK